MSTNKESSAIFRVGSKSLSCSDISSILDWMPTRQIEKGTPISKSNPQMVREDSICINETGISEKELRKKIEKIKQERLPRSGPKRNPDVVVDTDSGDVYPKTESDHGDSIGNIFD